MARDNKKVFRMEKDIAEPVAPPPVGDKVHVDFYLKAKGVPLWERGGKREFAMAKGLQFGTDKQFEDLFKLY